MLNFKSKSIKNICLIGMMGSGKTIIGRELSKKYDVIFYDSDTEIESHTKKTINLIFENYGEKYFREIEEKTCSDLIKKNNCIISLGGGSITSEKVRWLLKEHSITIYLKTNISILVTRLMKSKKRPLLNQLDKKKVLEDLYEKRKKYYNNADIVVKNNNEKNEMVSKIILELEKYE